MELAIYDLYAATGRIVEFEDEENVILREPLIWEAGPSDFYYTVKAGDELDKIAYMQYRNLTDNAERYWWVIADANNIENPLYLDELVGTEILIPNILNVKLKLQS